MNTRAPRRLLNDLEDSTGSVKAKKLTNNSWQVIGRVRLGDKTVQVKGTGPTQKTARERARKNADKRREAYLAEKDKPKALPGGWRTTDPITKFLDDEVQKMIDQAELKESSRSIYTRTLKRLRKLSENQTIEDFTNPTALYDLVETYEAAHGPSAAKQLTTVLSNFVFARLTRRGLAMAYPLQNYKPRIRKREVVALSPEQTERVRDYLLSLDTSKPMPGASHYRRPRPGQIARYEAVRVLTLLQLSTGLRVTEANAATWPDTIEDNDGLSIAVSEEVSKTDKGRTVPVMEDTVVKLLKERKKSRPVYLVGSPLHPDQQWERSNCRKATKQLYEHLAQVCDVPELYGPCGRCDDCKTGRQCEKPEARTHIWRATMNMRLIEAGVAKPIRLGILGHTEAVNAHSYTAKIAHSEIIGARELLKKPKAT